MEHDKGRAWWAKRLTHEYHAAIDSAQKVKIPPGGGAGLAIGMERVQIWIGDELVLDRTDEPNVGVRPKEDLHQKLEAVQLERDALRIQVERLQRTVTRLVETTPIDVSIPVEWAPRRKARLTDDEVAAPVKAFTTRELADDDWSSYDVVDGAGLVRAVEDMYLPPDD